MKVITSPSYSKQLQYRKALNELVSAMLKDIEGTFLLPSVATDAKPPTLAQKMKTLRTRWYSRFEKAGRELAKWSVNAANRRTTSLLTAKLQEVGFTFNPDYNDAQKAIISSIVDENVSYIKSIPQQLLKRLQSDLTDKYGYKPLAEIIKEAVIEGGDRNFIKNEIEKLGVITREHASNIARDQTNKTMQTLAVFNAKAMGATQGRWIHIQGKYSSRITHIHMNGKVFNLDRGMYDEAVGKYVMPAELPYCQCQFEVLLPEFEGETNEY